MNQNQDSGAKPDAVRRPLWLRITKWVTITVAAIALLVVAILGTAVWYLTPQKLTPMVNRAASSYLNANVEASRVELTFWKTFPRLEITLDSLEVVSRSLSDITSQQRATLPADADTLLKVRRFSGGINVAELTLGNIALYDVNIEHPRLNLVTLSDSVANFLIMPPSDTTGSSTSVMPPISIDRFAITGNFPVRYCAPSDSVDFTVTLRDSELKGHKAPLYTVSVRGDAGGKVHPLLLASVPFGIDGNIQWSQANPTELSFRDMKLTIGQLEAGFNATLDMADNMLLRDMTLDINEARLTDVINLIPDGMTAIPRNIGTDLTVKLGMSLSKEFRPLTDSIPSLEITATARASYLDYGNLHLKNLYLECDATVAGDNPDMSVLNLKRLEAEGRAVDVDLSALVTHPLSDPHLKGSFEGGVNLGVLPPALLEKLPVTINGNLRGETDFDFSFSDLTPKGFHKIKLNGMLALTDFTMAAPDSSLTAYTSHTVFRLGSSSRIVRNGIRLDSLLTASLTVDTAYMAMQGCDISGSDMKIGFATKNVSSTLDTTVITPLGINISAKRLTLHDHAVSTRMLMREATVRGSIQRYEKNDKAPLIKAAVEARTVFYADSFNRALLSSGHADLTLHPRTRTLSRRQQTRYDSIAAANPGMAPDSIMAIIRRPGHLRTDSHNSDMRLDDATSQLLRRWTASGKMTASSMRLFTPLFPLRTKVDSLNVEFSTDSLTLHNTHISAGKSRMTVEGEIRNIRSSLSGGGRRPLVVDMDVNSSFIDVNELTQAAMKGAAYARKVEEGTAGAVAMTDDSASLQKSVESQVDDSDMTAFVIPGNISASVKMDADNVVYSDVLLRHLTGRMSVYKGALSLERLAARSAVGDVNFSALLSAPSADSLSFAAGMNVRRMDLNHVMRLIPDLDSIMPMLKDMEGIVDADMAFTTQLDSVMNLRLNTLEMALKLSGDSLVLLDSETFATLSKWLMFKNKKRNMIDHMDVEMAVKDSRLNLYPFIFDMDRYRFGVRGGNDMGLNLDYHVSVLKSPLPFKFGINIKGTPDDMKIRVGKARINEKSVASTTAISDTARLNLVKEIGRMFRSGVRRARPSLSITAPLPAFGQTAESADTISHADSVMLIKEGVLTRPQGFVMPDENQPAKKKKK